MSSAICITRCPICHRRGQGDLASLAMLAGDIILMVDCKIVGLAKIKLDGLAEKGLGTHDVGKYQDRFRPEPGLLDMRGE